MAIDYKQSDFSPVVFPITEFSVMEEIAALRRILIQAEEAWAPWAAKEAAIQAEGRRLEELEQRERARIQRGQGSRDKAREYHQEANAVWRRLTDKNSGLRWETGYREAERNLESAKRRQTDYETLLAEWRAMEVLHNAKVKAKEAAEAAAKMTEEARQKAWQEARDREIASRPEGWQSFRWNGKDYDGDYADD